MNCNCDNDQKIIKHVEGNTLTCAIPLQDRVTRYVDGEKVTTVEDFYPLDTDTVTVRLTTGFTTIIPMECQVTDNVVTFTDNGSLPAAHYGIEITVVRASGDKKRYYSEYEINIVSETSEAGIPDDIEYDVETYDLEAAIFDMMRGYSTYEIWLQQGYEGTEADFLEWLTGAAQIDEKIAKIYRDLENYYTKLQTYNREEIDNMISAIPKFKIQVVAQLPTTNISVSTIYLVPGAYSEAGNLYTEYIYTGVRWEVLGKQNFDLSQYVTIQQLNNMLASYYTSSAIDALLQGYVVKVTGMGLSQNDFTNILKAKLDSLENYDDTEVLAEIAALTNRLDTLVGGDVTQAIETFNEVIAFLDGLSDTQSLAEIIASIQSEIATKANAATTYTKTEADAKFATNETVNSAAFIGGESGSSTTADFDPQTDTVWNIPQSLGSAAKAQARANIGAQEQLVSGTNVKTINDESILGEGNITIQGSGEANVIETVKVNGTALVPDQYKAVDITVPTNGVTFVNSAITEAIQGSQTSSMGYRNGSAYAVVIFGEEDLGLSASNTLTLSAAGNTITIDGTGISLNSINVSSFASKVSNATNGHLAGLDANGNLTDSGFKIVTITESAYDALATKDANTLYLITES